MVGRIAFLLLWMTSGLGVAAQAAPQSTLRPVASGQGEAKLPPVEQVLAKYVEALGGRAAIQKLTTRVMKGQFVGDAGETGPAEAYYKMPGQFHSSVEIPGFGVVHQGLEGAVGWEKFPDAGVRLLDGAELARTKREVDLHKALKLASLFQSLTVKGSGKVGDRDAYLVEAAPAEGLPETMYFDAETGLLLRVDVEQDTPDGRAVVERYYEDYRDVAGVKVAHTVRFVNPAGSYTLRFTSVEHNVPVPAARLARPASQ